MKKIILFIFLAMSSEAYSQKSICGVDFGSSYSTAERVLENKFGDKSALLSDKTQIVFQNKMYAGRMWSFLYFIFQSDGYKQFLNRCILVVECSTAAEAKKTRDDIKGQMESKYFIKEFTNDETGFNFYMGGIAPTGEQMCGFVIDVFKFSNAKYGARLDYGPYNYVKEEL